jgi:hypothetical protein
VKRFRGNAKPLVRLWPRNEAKLGANDEFKDDRAQYSDAADEDAIRATTEK